MSTKRRTPNFASCHQRSTRSKMIRPRLRRKLSLCAKSARRSTSTRRSRKSSTKMKRKKRGKRSETRWPWRLPLSTSRVVGPGSRTRAELSPRRERRAVARRVKRRRSEKASSPFSSFRPCLDCYLWFTIKNSNMHRF